MCEMFGEAHVMVLQEQMHDPNYGGTMKSRAVLLVIILTTWILYGCGPAAPTTSQQPTQLAQPTQPSDPTQPAEPTKLPEPTHLPEPTQPPEPTAPATPTFSPEGVHEVTFGNVRLLYNEDIAPEVVCETVAPEELFPSDLGTIPEHVACKFPGYVLANTFHEPVIRVYPVAELESNVPSRSDIAALLKQLLQGRPEEPQDIPMLPIWNAGPMTRAQVAYLDFVGGSGVRFLTQYGQALLPINNHELFYTFQGLTSDGQYYISAILPVSHPSLPADGSQVPNGDYYAFSENYATYIEQLRVQLNGELPDSFTPSLAQLDAMVQSLIVR